MSVCVKKSRNNQVKRHASRIDKIEMVQKSSKIVHSGYKPEEEKVLASEYTVGSQGPAS